MVRRWSDPTWSGAGRRRCGRRGAYDEGHLGRLTSHDQALVEDPEAEEDWVGLKRRPHVRWGRGCRED